MLVLTRRPGESIVVGQDIVITVIEIKGGQVRIGIDAPRDVDVYREEIYAEVSRQNRAAAEVNVRDLDDLPRPPQAAD